VQDLKSKNLTPAFGAEVTGLKPQIPLDGETIATLRKLFDQRGMLVFRDIDVDIKFQTYLSELLIGHDVDNPDTLALKHDFLVSNREEKSAAPYGRLLFHSDQMWSPKDRVDLISLYGKDVGQPATPTLFVSAAEGWETLPDALRARVADRIALQHYDPDTYKKRARGDEDVLVSTYNASDDESSQRTPVAFKHPRTGRTVLYICQQTTQNIEGLSQEDSDAVLDALFDHMYAENHQFAHQWRERDLVIWDNIALQHARPNVTIEGPARTLRKTLAPLPQSKLTPDYASITDTPQTM
jgi:alpha-ketoglutarate-dependent taurine dioxygenase